MKHGGVSIMLSITCWLISFPPFHLPPFVQNEKIPNIQRRYIFSSIFTMNIPFSLFPSVYTFCSAVYFLITVIIKRKSRWCLAIWSVEWRCIKNCFRNYMNVHKIQKHLPLCAQSKHHYCQAWGGNLALLPSVTGYRH